MICRKLILGVATAALVLPSLAQAQGAPAAPAASAAPADPKLSVLQPVPNDYKPKKTAWGDPDLRGTWPIDSIASLPFQRPKNFGTRFYLTEQEYQARLQQAAGSDARYDAEDKNNTIGFGHWVESDAAGRSTALLVSPADGQLPAFTPEADKLYKAGRSSWTPNTDYDWTDDFDTWDRCVTRGFPASMFPFRYNNGIQVFQSPGHVVINLEMIHDSRVVPVVSKAKWADLQKTRWDPSVRTWMGQSLGYWEDDNTLVIETTNIKTGDSATTDVQARGPSPLNMATLGVPPWNTIPTSAKAKVVERITMTGPDSIVYELTYSDPDVFVAPWTARLDWTRNEEYGFFEYACHEGNVQVRNYINSSRAQRGLPTSKVGEHTEIE
jgi:hypothetical protein